MLIALLPRPGLRMGRMSFPLRAICVGIRVICINDDGIGLEVIRSDEVIDEGLSDIEQFLAGQAVLQTRHRRLGSQVNPIRSRPSVRHTSSGLRRGIARRNRRHLQSRPLSGISSGGASPSGCVPPWVPGADL